MLSDSPGSSRWNQDRLFPIITIALVVVLVVGLMSISGYILLARRGPTAPPAQAMALREFPTSTPLPVEATVAASPTPLARPTHTPVVAATPTPTAMVPLAEETLSPLPTPPLPTSTVALEEAGAKETVPTPGLGLAASAGVGVALVGVLWGARALRGRHRW